MIRILAMLSILGLTACLESDGHRYGHAQPLPRADGVVRLATYNVLNLFDHADDRSLGGRHDDLEMATTDERCRALASAIRAVNADIVAMQEVESLACLKWFRDTYLADMGYAFMASEDVGYYRGVECSVLSRFKITDVRTYSETDLDRVRRTGAGWQPMPQDGGRGLRYQRSPLHVDVQIDDDYALTLFVLHHKAGRDFMWHRESEALATTAIVGALMEHDPERNVVVLGDFNAAPWDKSLRVYLESGLIDTLGHRIIPRWKDADMTESDLFKTHESGRVIDYVLLNSAAHREFVVGSAHVYGTRFFPDYDWRNDPHPPGYASDHYPVVVDLVPRDRR